MISTIMRLIIISTLSQPLAEVGAATPQPQPLIRNGSCPTGYLVSAEYCVPTKSAQYALPRIGSCPSGYNASNNYCVGSSDKSTLAFIKKGSCPSGFHQSGQYCIGN